MTSRVHWTCPGCQKTYAVPDATGLTLCPACRARSLPSRFLLKATVAALVGIILVAGWLWWRSSRPNLIAPIAAVILGDPDKKLAESWLKENLNEGEWEEVRWWPAVEMAPYVKEARKPLADELAGIPAQLTELRRQKTLLPDLGPLKDRIAVLKKSPSLNTGGRIVLSPDQKERQGLERKLREELDKHGELNYQIQEAERRQDKLTTAIKRHDERSPHRRMARMKFRTKGPFGAKMLYDKLFAFEKSQVVECVDFPNWMSSDMDMDQFIQELLN